jgi:hypothetical protein
MRAGWCPRRVRRRTRGRLEVPVLNGLPLEDEGEVRRRASGIRVEVSVGMLKPFVMFFVVVEAIPHGGMPVWSWVVRDKRYPMIASTLVWMGEDHNCLINVGTYVNLESSTVLLEH